MNTSVKIPRKDFISSLLAFGIDRDDVIRYTQNAYKIVDREGVANYVGVVAHELRKLGILKPIEKGPLPSRHTIVKRGLLRDKTNQQILKSLRKAYPQIDDKTHKQRICEYRWFHNHSLL